MVVLMGEGEADKPLMFEEKETEFMGVKPYLLLQEAGRLVCYPKVSHELSLEEVLTIFRNIFVIEMKS